MENSKAMGELSSKTGLPKMAARFFIAEFIMTLKKYKRAQAEIIKGQAIFEYFILTTAVVAVVLFFANTDYFKGIKSSCEKAFNQATQTILEGEGSPGGGSTEWDKNTGAGSVDPSKNANIELISPAFENNQFIPPEFSFVGKNVNPPLFIAGVPKEAKSLALIFEDPDALRGTWVHWVVFDIPVVSQIEENNVLGKKGTNSFGTKGYAGPMPPPGTGTHRYFFKIYALDTMLNLQEGISKAQLVEAMQGHILAELVLIGLYGR